MNEAVRCEIVFRALCLVVSCRGGEYVSRSVCMAATLRRSVVRVRLLSIWTSAIFYIHALPKIFWKSAKRLHEVFLIFPAIVALLYCVICNSVISYLLNFVSSYKLCLTVFKILNNIAHIYLHSLFRTYQRWPTRGSRAACGSFSHAVFLLSAASFCNHVAFANA